MKKENLYNLYQTQVKDKDTALDTFFQRVLCMTSKMFEYTGLPDSIPQVELENILQTSGNVGIAKVNGELYALQGSRGGECDAYYRGKDFIVANPWLKLDKTYKIDSDIVVINNTPFADSILPVIGKYGVLYTDAVITLNMTSVLTRITMLISASDDKTKQSAESFLKKILDGDFSVIGENAFFKGVNMQTPPTNSNQQITQLIELLQYYKASLFNDLGLNANYNMKRERLNTQEVSMNIDALMPYVDSMLTERVEGVKRVNEMFGTEITVTLGSSWKIEHENYLSLLKATEEGHEHTETEDVDPVTENENEEKQKKRKKQKKTQETEETEKRKQKKQKKTEEPEEEKENKDEN